MQKQERATFPQPRQGLKVTKQRAVMKRNLTRAAAHQNQVVIRVRRSTTS